MSSHTLLDRVRDALGEVARDGVAIALLEIEVGYQRLADYERLSDTVSMLRQALITLERNLDDIGAQIEKRDKRIEKLQQEYKALQERAGSQVKDSASDQRREIFKKLEPLAVQLPTLRHSLESGDDISTEDIIALVAPLHEALADMGFEPIGKPGAKLKFDPTRHRAVGKGARSLAAGDAVNVRYVGYTHEGKVVRKAQVTAA